MLPTRSRDWPRRSIATRSGWRERITGNLDREFVYLVRHMRPQDAAQVKALGIPGVYLLREYRRYYPAGEVTGHVLGFTSVDDVGQEGLELAYDQWLGGEAGRQARHPGPLRPHGRGYRKHSFARPGQDLVTSIDLRIQYLAYRELKAAIQQHNAKAGSVVVLDVDDRRSAGDGEPAGLQPERS